MFGMKAVVEEVRVLNSYFALPPYELALNRCLTTLSFRNLFLREILELILNGANVAVILFNSKDFHVYVSNNLFWCSICFWCVLKKNLPSDPIVISREQTFKMMAQ
jgi:hypothetical protein